MLQNLIANGMATYLMILSGLVFGLGALVINMISSLDGSFKPHMKSSLVYLILSFLIFSFIGLASYPDVFESLAMQFFFLLVFFFFVGIFYMYSIRKYM